MSVQFNPNTMQRRADGPLPFGRTQLDQGKPNEVTRSGTRYGGPGASKPDFPKKHDIPTTLLNERMNDGEINCLEREIHQSAEGDTLVFLDDRYNVDGNRAGHVLIRNGETGRLRDPSSNQPMEEFDSLEAWNQGQKTRDVQPDPYVKSGELEATEVEELMKLSSEQRRAHVAESGNAEEIADAEATITNMGGLYEELGLMGSHNNNGGQEISDLRSGLFTATTTYGKANTAAGQEAIALSQMQNLRDADGGPAIGVVDKDGYYRSDIVVEYMGRGTNDPQIVNLPEGESASDFTIVEGAQAKGAITVLDELDYGTRQIPTELPARRGPDTRYNPFDVTVSNESVDSDSARFGIIQSAGLTHWDYDKEIDYEDNFDLVADPWSGVDDESVTEALWSGYNALAINDVNAL